MDPFSLKLLGQIRQQELLEQAAKGRDDTRRWLWRISTFQLDLWQERDDVARTPPFLTDGRPRFNPLRGLAFLLLRLLGRARRISPPSFVPQESTGAPQSMTDPQCISEC